jgi:hypothetical protein
VNCANRSEAGAPPSGEPGENLPLIRENVIEFFLIPEQPIQLALIGFDPFLIRENLPLIDEHLPLIGKHLPLVRGRRV